MSSKTSAAHEEEAVSAETARAKQQELEERLDHLDTAIREARAREAQFRILSELVTDCCWVRWRSRDGSEERGWINDAFTRLTGYTAEEFEKIGRSGLVHPDDLEKIQDFIDGPPGISEHSFRILRKDGEVRHLHERMEVREEDGGMTVYGATRDVTDEMRARKVWIDRGEELERRVEERTAELVQANRRLEREVEERRRVSRELRTAKEQAETASRAKSRFLATMTHELRTPLHGIVGLTDLLLAERLDEPASEWVRTLESSAKALRHMVEEVLDFSKIEAEQMLLEEAPFSLVEMVEDLKNHMAGPVGRRNNRMGVHVASGLPERVSGDATRLRQVLLNLLDNAAKFTEGGEIELTVAGEVDESGGRLVRFEVRDTGIGFDDETRGRIFEPFTQADASTTRRYGGTGLGLAICRRLVELLGGELEVESRPGRGSRFTFAVPLPPVEDPAVVDPDAPKIDGSGRRVLVAEDNPVNQLVIREQLEGLGFEVRVVDDGRQALEVLQREPFDVWLLDGHMPVMDGFEAVRRWRQMEPPGRRLPVIGVTATALEEELEDCLQAGMDELLTKPYRLKNLAEVLRRRLGEPRA